VRSTGSEFSFIGMILCWFEETNDATAQRGAAVQQRVIVIAGLPPDGGR
jgi:hypothetical protein